MGSRPNVCRYAFGAGEFYLLMRDKRGVLNSFSGHPFKYDLIIYYNFFKRVIRQ